MMKSRRNRSETKLDEAIRAWRSGNGDSEGLSASSRERILDRLRAHDAEEASALPSLFAPIGRLVMAGALPVVLAGGLFLALHESGTGPDVMTTPTQVRVAKQGDRAVFEIANGDRQHNVRRSTDPSFASSTPLTVTDGGFVERLDDPSSLVFYRID